MFVERVQIGAKRAESQTILLGGLLNETFAANREVNNALVRIEEITENVIPSIMNTYPDLIENITRVMSVRGITRDDLVDHVANATIIDKTLGRQRYLDGCMLAKLADALGVTVDELKMQH